MPQSHTAAFFDLEPAIEASLTACLRQLGFQLATKPQKPDLVFCSQRSQHLARLLRSRLAPVVVVGRDDSTQAWLSALDAGAADYLCEGFEPIQVRWLVQSLLRDTEPVSSALELVEK